MQDTLAREAAARGVPLTNDQLAQFDAYYRLLVEWSARFNLTRITEAEAVQVQHFLDSLALLAVAGEWFPHQAKVIDARERLHSERPAGTVPYLGRDLVLGEDVPADPVALERWYRRQARKELEPRVRAAVTELASTAPGRIRIEYSRTAIRDQRTRWGSCSAKGTISLNWRLLLAPDEVAEYVVVHEVCHLAEMNHSANYWELVAALFPEYERPRRWLRDHGSSLSL